MVSCVEMDNACSVVRSRCLVQAHFCETFEFFPQLGRITGAAETTRLHVTATARMHTTGLDFETSGIS